MPPETKVGLRLLPTNPVLFTTRLLISRFRVGFGLLGAMGNWVLVGGRKMHDVILKLFLLITRRQKEIFFQKQKQLKSLPLSARRLSVTKCDRFLFMTWLPGLVDVIICTRGPGMSPGLVKICCRPCRFYTPVQMSIYLD
jgi:hypothetical protein